MYPDQRTDCTSLLSQVSEITVCLIRTELFDDPSIGVVLWGYSTLLVAEPGNRSTPANELVSVFFVLSCQCCSIHCTPWADTVIHCRTIKLPMDFAGLSWIGAFQIVLVVMFVHC